MTPSKQDKLNAIVRAVFKGITPDDLLSYDVATKSFWVGKTQLGATEAEQLKQQALGFRESLVWRLIKARGAELAVKRIAEESKEWEDVFFGKAMLYNLDVLDRWLANLASREVSGTQE